MVTILISATFRSAALIREEALIRERHLFQCGHPNERCLIQVQLLLEEIWYMNCVSLTTKLVLLRDSAVHTKIRLTTHTHTHTDRYIYIYIYNKI